MTGLFAAVMVWLPVPAVAKPQNRPAVLTQTVTVRESPPRITLQWQNLAGSGGYNIYRKALSATSWGTVYASVRETASPQFDDDNVAVGVGYDYKVVTVNQLTSGAGYSWSSKSTCIGYVYSGIALPAVDNRGKLILLVDNTLAAPLAGELGRLEQDLVGDGWTVLRHDVGRQAVVATNATAAEVSAIKAIIQTDYNTDTNNVKMVFIIGGGVPCPIWSTRPNNRSDDGAYSLTNRLGVGRVSMIGLESVMGLSEVELTRRYLNKDHAFRHRRTAFQARAGGFTLAYSQEVQSFQTLVGRDKMDGGYTPLDSTSLFSGGAEYFVEQSYPPSLYAANNFQVVFGMIASEHGWGDSSAAAVASGGAYLIHYECGWGGGGGVNGSYNHWMAMGEPIGTCQQLYASKANLYSCLFGLNMSLNGDPTVRMLILAPPGGLTVSGDTLSWDASYDAGVDGFQGYHVYRATSMAGPFTRLTTTPVAGTSWTDPSPLGGVSVYQVRTIKLETSNTGSYYNNSQGIFATRGAVGIVPSARWVRVAEGATSSFRVKLSSQPASNVTVSVARSAGDANVSVVSGSSLAFTPSNWNVWQDVTLAAAWDGDTVDGNAAILLSASGLTNVTVGALMADGAVEVDYVDYRAAPEGGYTTYRVRLSSPPASDVVAVSTKTASGSGTKLTIFSGAYLAFTPANWREWQTVTIAYPDDHGAAVSSQGIATFNIAASGYRPTGTKFYCLEKHLNSLGIRSVPEWAACEPPNQSVAPAKGEATPVSVTPGAGYRFEGWVFDVGWCSDNALIADPSSPITTVTPTLQDGFVTCDIVAAVRVGSPISLISTLRDPMIIPVAEEGTNSFKVRLTACPPGAVVVSIAYSKGDADITVKSGANLTFATTNWDQWQTVTLAAAADEDSGSGSTILRITGAGLVPSTVWAYEVEEKLSLTVKPGVGGLATTPDLATAAYVGAPAAIRAVPNLGYRFDQWFAVSGDVTFEDPYAANTTVIPAGSANIRALFVPDTSSQPPTIVTPAWVAANLTTSGTTRVGVACDTGSGALVYAWSQVSGPGLAAFISPCASESVVSFSAAGTYVLRVTIVNARGETAYSDVTVTAVGVQPEAFDLSVPEGGTTALRVKLSAQPSSDVTVSAVWASGDSDITVQSGAGLTFTPADWDSWQTLTLGAAQDGDTADGSAVIALAASGGFGTTVIATEADNDTTLLLNNGIGGTVSPAGYQVVTKGVATPIFAAPGAGYGFAQWAVSEGSASVADSLATNTTVTISDPVTLRANFLDSVNPGNSETWIWGDNISGQIGDGTVSNSLWPKTISFVDGDRVAGGWRHTVARKDDGTVWAWGMNSYGQIGDGTNLIRKTPVQAAISNVTAVAAGYAHTLAIQTNGSVWAWGGNSYGELGDGTKSINRYSPVNVSNLAGIAQVAAGQYFSMALATNGSVWSWGYNYYGQLGIGTYGMGKLNPVQVPGLTGVVGIAAGNAHVMALATNGTLFGWGYNGSGQLGDETYTTRLVPTPVPGLMDVTHVTGSDSRTYAVKNDGTLWAWGFWDVVGGMSANSPLQIADGIAATAAGYMHALAITTNGSLAAWGDNGFGQLGNGLPGTNWAYPTVLSNMTGVVGVAAGHSHSMALKDDGSVWTWGNNSTLQLGNGTSTNRSTPSQISGIPNVMAIAAGYAHSVALKTDGTLWTWGFNCYGQLGDGTNVNKSTPGQVLGLSNVMAIAAGRFHSMALKNDGTVWAWGYNYYGTLGDGTAVTRLTPVPVLLPDGTPLSNVVAITVNMNGYASYALKSDGTVWAWGLNSSSQLGLGYYNNDRITPLPVPDLSGISQIAVGALHSMALASDGTVWTWGYNYYGQVGVGTNAVQPSPAQVPDLAEVTQIAAGYYHSMALKRDGTVWAWGRSFYGGLGDGTTSNRFAPVQVVMSDGTPLSDVVAIAGGQYHSMAMQSDGSIWTWGGNDYGQLGAGSSDTSPHPNPVQVTAPDGMALVGASAMCAGANHTVAVIQKQVYVRVQTSASLISLPEGGTATIQVKLSAKPLSAVTVTATRTSGEANVTGTSLTFTTNNWWTYQNLTLTSVGDADTEDSSAMLFLSGAGVDIGAAVTVTKRDRDTMLTTGAGAGGTTLPAGDIRVTRNAATPIVAKPESGYVFVNWTLADGSAVIANPNVTNTTVTIGAPAAIQANFVPVGSNRNPLIVAAARANATLLYLPSATTTVQVAASDPDGDPLFYAWSKVSGPGDVVFNAPAAAEGVVGFGVAGSYNLRVTVSDDRGGSVNSVVSVDVRPMIVPPIITTQPADIASAVGQNVPFWVNVTGDNLSFQWYKNGVEIFTGTRSSYDAPWVPFADNGAKFKVRVWNEGGSVMSREATMTVVNELGGDGLTGRFYNNYDFTSLFQTKVDAYVNYGSYGGYEPPFPLSTFGARWTGQVRPQFTETYTFHVMSCGDTRLWVNGVLLAAYWPGLDNARTDCYGAMAMIAGQKYDIRLDYRGNSSQGDVTLNWSSAHVVEELIRSPALYPTTSGTNYAPMFAAGASVDLPVVELPAGTTVRVQACDQNETDTLSYAWTQVSGSGTATFAAPTATVSAVTFSAAGSYVLRATVSDGQGCAATSEVAVTVNEAGSPPVILGNYSALTIPENGYTDGFCVRLSKAPTNTVTITITRTAGDSDLNMISIAPGGGVTTFNSIDWSTWKAFRTGSGHDADTTDGTATFTLSAPGHVSATVTMTEADDDTTLTLVSSAGGRVAPAGATVVQKGAATSISATSTNGYCFSGWSVTNGTASIANVGAVQTTVAISAPATVWANFAVIGGGENAPPVANAQSISMLLNTVRAITLTGSDPEGSNLTYTVETGPTHGSLTGAGASRTYTPDTNYVGSDSFTFTVNDGALTSTPATVAITVRLPNRAPTVTASGTPTNGAAPLTVNFTATGADADGDPLSYAWTFGDGGTSTAQNPGHVFASAGFYTSIVTVADGNGGITNTSVTLEVTVPVNQPPVANTQSFSTVQDTAVAITLTGSDPEGSNLIYTVVTNPAHGTLTGTGANHTYTPATNYVGADSFTFTVNDGALTSSPATVSITVTVSGSGGGVLATGGTVTNYSLNGTNFTVHVFTNVGSSTFTPATALALEYLVVGGGGGGGAYGGGGGAGGVFTGMTHVTATVYAVVVGGGGAGAVWGGAGSMAGTNSSFGAIVAAGGHGGTTTGSGGSSGNGFSGGTINGVGAFGGGAGAGAIGGNFSGNTGGGTAGAGGIGLLSSIRGTTNYYGGGGGGGAYCGSSSWYSNIGGSGGGGNGAGNGTASNAGTNPGGNGAANTGGGGGGGAGSKNGGSGGSGIVIVRYVTGGAPVPPEAPSGLTATAAATNRVELVWVDNAGDETGYVVDRSTDSNFWVAVTLAETNATTHSDTGLALDTLYYYRVAASNAVGLSTYCYASATTWSDYTLWRLAHFTAAELTNLAVSGAAADFDQDGMSNEQEYRAGTSPTNAASCLMFHVVQNNPVASDEFLLSWQSVSNKFYTLQAGTNVLTGFTVILGSNIPATYPVNVYTEQVVTAGFRLFRVKVE